MKHFLLFIICYSAFFSRKDLYAQNECGTDQIHEKLMQTDTAYRTSFILTQQQIQSIVREESLNNLRGSNEIYTIPVVVHVIHVGEQIGTGTNVSDANIIASIDRLNQHYSGTNGLSPDIQINFCLATRDPNGCPTTGINRVDGRIIQGYEDNGINFNGCSEATDQQVKDLSKWSTLDYYNIWVVNFICGWPAGYANFPNGGDYDGTVIEAYYMTNPSLLGGNSVLTHEVGHGFGLYHTFQGDGGNSYCPSNEDCLYDGDKICDTPPHKESDCSGNNPCTNMGVWDNCRYNYMSYCTYKSRFTEDQKTRMRATMLVYPRANLLNSLGCASPDFGTTVSKTNVTCYGLCDGSISVNPSNQCSSSYTYSWNNGNTSNEINGLCPGIYDVTITDNNNLTTVLNITVTEPDTLLNGGTPNISPSIICSGDSINLSLIGVPGNIQWQSSTDNVNFSDIDGGISSNYSTVLTSPTYFRAISSCSNVPSSSVTTTLFPLPIASINANGPTTYCEGNVILTSDFADHYNWSNGDTIQSITVNSSGEYSLIVTDINGCSSTPETVSISNNMGSWTQKADFSDIGRYSVFAFSIGSKAYVGTGSHLVNPYIFYRSDFWEYDSNTDTWTQKADFPGGVREAAVSFTIGSKGYVGTGSQDSNNKNDFWEYDPNSDTWTQKGDFPGGERVGSVGFSIGLKGYLGTGFNNNEDKNDFWEYEPSTDTWTQKADFSGSPRRVAVGFSINGMGYLGTGYSNGITKKDFWQYNPLTDSWIQKSDITGFRQGAIGFSLNGKGYIGMGRYVSFYKDMWEYNTSSNSWSRVADFGSSSRMAAVAVVIGNLVYAGLGLDNSWNDNNDFWKFTPPQEDILSSFTFNQNDPLVDFLGNIQGGTPPYNYSWDFGDSNTDTILSPSHTYSSNGLYNITFCVTDNNTCTDCETQQINIITTNIDNPFVVNRIFIYPTPATSEITVNGYSPAYLKLVNALGQTVTESNRTNKLYVGNVSEGLYVLQLFDGNGQQVKTEKVIVVK